VQRISQYSVTIHWSTFLSCLLCCWVVELVLNVLLVSSIFCVHMWRIELT